MFETDDIIHREINKSHLKEQEYWGPIDHSFSDAFLAMAYEMLRNYFSKEEIRIRKAIISTITELIQNIADYNAIYFPIDPPTSYFNLVLCDHNAKINCSNQILEQHSEDLKQRFMKLQAFSRKELQEKYKNALLHNESLGLLILHKFPDVKIDWKFKKSGEGFEWLNIYVTLNYASFRN